MIDLRLIPEPPVFRWPQGNRCPEDRRAEPRRGSLLRAVLRFLLKLPANLLLLLIQLYQRTLSPALPVFFGAACGCRFSPTCSHYAATAIRVHGALLGTVLAAIRLLKCTPLHPGGNDPVPSRGAKPRCVRLPA